MINKIVVMVMASVLAGCSVFSTQDAAPVVDLQTSDPITTGFHVVQTKESLYSIAWRYGRDYRDIAQANNIAPPYVIHPGQRLTLKASGTAFQAPPAAAVTTANAPPTHFAFEEVPSASSTPKNPPRFVAQEELPKETVVSSAPVQELSKVQPKTVLAPKIEESKPLENKVIPEPEYTFVSPGKEAPKVAATVATGASKWIWPAKGEIIKPYAAHTATRSKGIDIAGALGAPVKAAGAGKIVYSGAGLRGYGQLVIIKHNDTYLSAYAHNSKLLVKEGQSVSQGQTIAEMGQSDADRVKLHFEIRKNGQPINPITLLPTAG